VFSRSLPRQRGVDRRGSPVQSALIAKRIWDLAEEKSIPVIAFTEDVAASGGYWLTCAGDVDECF
jgi:ClpP class serine protease